MRKIVLLILGIVFCVLGLIGLLIPIIPQIPFFVLGLLCLSAASTRFKRYLLGTKLYQKHLQAHVEKHEKLAAFLQE